MTLYVIDISVVVAYILVRVLSSSLGSLIISIFQSFYPLLVVFFSANLPIAVKAKRLRRK